MKKKILFGLISLSSILSLQAQIYTPNGIIQGSSSNNNVGIGITPSIDYPLHVFKQIDGLSLINIQNSSVVSGSGSGIRFFTLNNGGGGSWWSNIALKGDSKLHFNMEQKEDAMIIDQQGNVGIGTINPLGTLHIQKNVANGIGPVLLLQNNQYYNSSGAGSAIKFLGFGEPAMLDRYIQLEAVMGETSMPDNFSVVFNNDGTIIRPLIIKYTGSVGIGTTETGTHKLAVGGTIGAREIKVEAGTWSDFVFGNEFKLKKLQEVEKFIEENNHLPDIPSEREVKENGIQLGEMNAKLLQKIEELTLYMIEQNKKIETIEEQNKLLKQEIEILKTK